MSSMSTFYIWALFTFEHIHMLYVYTSLFTHALNPVLIQEYVCHACNTHYVSWYLIFTHFAFCLQVYLHALFVCWVLCARCANILCMFSCLNCVYTLCMYIYMLPSMRNHHYIPTTANSVTQQVFINGGLLFLH